MAAPTGAFVLKNSSITIATVEYANQITKARLVADTPVQTVRTLVPDGQVSDTDSALWTFELSFLQINSTGGLALALRTASPGTQMAVVYTPALGTGNAKMTFTMVSLPPPFGGDQGQYMVAEMTFAVIGQPVASVVP
jgi:hypothetical protein